MEIKFSLTCVNQLLSWQGLSTRLLDETDRNKNKIFISNHKERCDELKLSLQEEQAGVNTNIFDEEFSGTADKLLEYKCISKKQQKILIIKCLDWMKTMKLTEEPSEMNLLGIHHQNYLQQILLIVNINCQTSRRFRYFTDN